MENQHRRISGYRELSQAEIDLMNEVKALGHAIETVVLKVQAHVSAQRTANANLEQTDKAASDAEQQRMDDASPERFTAQAKIDFQTALMYLTRSVAQPTFF